MVINTNVNTKSWSANLEYKFIQKKQSQHSILNPKNQIDNSKIHEEDV